MNILIANTQVPFLSGGAEIQAQSLRRALEKEGHRTDILTIPFSGYPCENVLNSVPFLRMSNWEELSGYKVDLVIGLKFPAYTIPHPNKVIWLIHQHRDAYDLWESGEAALLKHPTGAHLRQAIEKIDGIAFQESRKIFTESRTVSERLKRFNQIDAKPLYHPPLGEEKFFCAEAKDYLFFPSRITLLKRQDLVLHALAKTKNPVKVIFSGVFDSVDFQNTIDSLVSRLNLRERVRFLGFISEEEKFRLYSEARAVIYPPFSEDYGYITLESMLSSKPVVSCSDSGGPQEFIRDQETGWITKPEPEPLAKCLDEIWENPSRCAKLGKNGREFYREQEITWKKVVQTLCG